MSLQILPHEFAPVCRVPVIDEVGLFSRGQIRLDELHESQGVLFIG